MWSHPVMENPKNLKEVPKEMIQGSSSGTNNDGIFVSVSSRGGVELRQESSEEIDSNVTRISVTSRGGFSRLSKDGEGNQSVSRHSPEVLSNTTDKMKHNSGTRKTHKQGVKKKYHKNKSSRTEKDHISMSDICVGATPPEESSERVTTVTPLEGQSLLTFMPQPVPNVSGKEHVIDEDETDTDDPYLRNAPCNHNANARIPLSNIWGELSLPEDASQLHDYRQQGTESSSSFSDLIFTLDSILEPFLNNGISSVPEVRVFSAQDEADVKLLQILRYIKSCDDGIILLWNFISDHVKLLRRGRRTSTTDVGTYIDSDIVTSTPYEGPSMYYNENREHPEYVVQEYEVQDEASEDNASDYSGDLDGEKESDEIELSECDIESQEGNSDSDSGTGADTATCEGEDYPYEEIQDDCNEDDEDDNSSSDSDKGCGNNGTKSGMKLEDKFSSICTDDLSDLLSNISLSSIDSSCCEDEQDTLLFSEKEAPKVSTGTKTASTGFREDKILHIFPSKKVKVRKHRKPYSFRLSQPLKRINGRAKKYTFRHPQHVKKYKENSDGRHKLEKVTDVSSDECSENDTHCRGDFVNEKQESQNHDDKEYSGGDEDLKGGDTRTLQRSPLNVVESINLDKNDPATDVNTANKTSEITPLMGDANSDDKGKNIKCNLLQLPLLAVGVGDSKTTAGSPSATENVIESLLLNEDMNAQEQCGKEYLNSELLGCPVWKILRKLECPFKWAPDLLIRTIPKYSIQENIVSHLMEKEKEFSMAKPNVFREVVVHLVLAYEKSLENRTMEAIADLQHCYSLLGNPQMEIPLNKIDVEKIDLNLVAGGHLFDVITTRRTKFMQNPLEYTTATFIDSQSHGEDSRNVKPSESDAAIQNDPRPDDKDTQTQFSDIPVYLGWTHVPSKTSNATELEGTDELVEGKKSNFSECPYTMKTRNCQDMYDVLENADTLSSCDKQNETKETHTKMYNVAKHSTENPEIIDVDAQIHKETQSNDNTQKGELCNKSNDVYNEDTETVSCNFKPFETEFDTTDITEKTSGVGISSTNCKDEQVKIDSNEALVTNKEASNVCERNNLSTENRNAPAETTMDEKLAENSECSESKLFEVRSEDELAIRRNDALLYVINATLAHLAYFSESSQEAYKLAKYLEDGYEKLGKTGQATVSALRGALLMEYGFTGNKLGLSFLEHALELDPDHWEWNLYYGKVLGRVRRVENIQGGEPDTKELKFLEKAVELHREDASTLVHLANVYRSLAHFQHRRKTETQEKESSVTEKCHYVRYGGSTKWTTNWSQSRQAPQEEPRPMHRWRNPQRLPEPRTFIPMDADIKDYLHLARKLFLEALQLEPNCPYNNARCAKGLWAMPHPYKDKNAAKYAILRSLTLAPDNSLVNHYGGLFYEYFRDYEKALSCFERATLDTRQNFPAEINYVNLKMKMSPKGSYSPIFRLDRMITKYSRPYYMQQALCHKALYLYKVEEQYFQSIRNIAAAIKIDPSSQVLKTFYPGDFYGRLVSYNMFDLLDEVVLKYTNCPDALENKDFVEEILETLKCYREENSKSATK